jgi:hypothetical protein
MDGGDAQAKLRQHLGRGKSGRQVLERRDDGGGGDIARTVAPCPVGHRPEPDIGTVDQRILVARAHGAGMRGGAAGQWGAHPPPSRRIRNRAGGGRAASGQ